MQYQHCCTRRLLVTLLAAPIFSPAIAFADDAAAFDHGIDPLAPVEPARAFGADVTFERQFGEEFFRDYWALNPERAIAAGQFQFADRTAVLDSRARAEALGKLNEWLSQLHRFNPATLNDANRSDWWLLNNTFEAERWAFTEYRAWEWNPALYNATAPLAAILQSDYAPLEQRLRVVLKRLNEVSTYYSTARQNLLHPALDFTLKAIEDNRQGLEVLGPGLSQRIAGSQLRDSEKALFTRRIAAARIAIEGYVAWLQEMTVQPADGTETQPAVADEHPAPAASFVTTTGSPDHSSLVRTFFGNNALTARWSTRQARVRMESAGNIRQSALTPTVQ